MKKILLVEDSIDCYEIVNSTLHNDFELSWVKSIKEAKSVLNHFIPDLTILDVSLPDGTGYNILTYLKESAHLKNIPTIMLTAKQEISDKVYGFTMGASDYLCKPFEPLELKMRVMARIKKSSAKSQISYKNISINTINSEVKILSEGSWVKLDLTGTEYKMIKYFAQSPEKVLSREDLLDHVWGEDVHLYPRIVDTYISRLRRKIKPGHLFLKSKNRLGYLLTASAH